jgi:hypothetical protein
VIFNVVNSRVEENATLSYSDYKHAKEIEQNKAISPWSYMGARVLNL